MNKEELIRDEANDFTYMFSEGSFMSDDHKNIINNLKSELRRFYQTEYKMIYLDQVNKALKAYLANHKKVCTRSGNCETEVFYQKLIFFTDQEIDELPKIIQSKIQADNKNDRQKVFISYSRADLEWLNKLKRHFKPLENQIDFWDDSKIEMGRKWKEEINLATKNAKVAILLISADFFNSDFIIQNELPPLLESAQNAGATILSVILKPCMFEEYESISQYQAINSPKRTLLEMNEAGQEQIWVELVRQVKQILDKS